MELQHHQSGVLPANGSALNTPSVETPLDGTSSQYRGVLQERSANWPHDNTASPITNTQHTSQKVSRSQSPTENGYTQQTAAAGNYFTGSLHAQHIGLAGCGVERSEKQIKRDTARLYLLLQRSDKYQKYREKQPVLTPREFIEREAREAKMKVEKDNKSPEKSVWPEFLEHAFWRGEQNPLRFDKGTCRTLVADQNIAALIRWPPMGRKKFMLDGALRGRNELIQDSIYKDTGIRRDRKQVSSHLQVLKQHLKDQPGVLAYMATKDEDKKRHRGREAASSYHLSHLGGRHHPQQRVAGGSRYDYSASAPFWSGLSSLQSSLGLGLNGATGMSPYAVTDFTMLVEDGDQPVHDFTQLSRDGRQQDLNVTDTATWQRQYPEFAFLQKQSEEWTKKHQKIIVCDASIKVMTETRPNAQLSIAFDLHSQRDLRPFESLESNPQFDGPHHHDLKEHRTSCEYTPDPHGCSGRLRLAFGSRFWVNRMSRYQSLRHKDDNLVGRSLMRLTATQDVYGVNPSGAVECVLTILWRFRQTRDSAEVGVMKWRAVSFGSLRPQPPQLHIDTLATWPCTAPDLDQPSASAAPSTATDHSFASLPNLSHSQGTAPGFDANDFDFSGGRIDISGAFSPAIMAQYEAFSASQGADLSGLNALSGMDHQSLLDLGLNATDIATITSANGLQDAQLSQVSVQNCYSIKPVPSWHHGASLISSLENQAETYHSPWSTRPSAHHQNHHGHGHTHQHQHHVQQHAGLPISTYADELVGHGNLHSSSANLNPGLWNLASPFHEDTGSGALNMGNVGGVMGGVGHVSGVMERKDSMQQSGLGLGVLDLIERDQRARGY
ncbi:hypothetical protein EJ07DRAFT_167805 [Lizonia empirigonia]|nr:hypothetical protein EJ07DRAFT_167805 [Lizonia empirigonia]